MSDVPPGKPTTPPGRPELPGRAAAAARAALGNRYKPPAGIPHVEGDDRLREVAKANSAGKTTAARCRAFTGGVPALWKSRGET